MRTCRDTLINSINLIVERFQCHLFLEKFTKLASLKNGWKNSKLSFSLCICLVLRSNLKLKKYKKMNRNKLRKLEKRNKNRAYRRKMKMRMMRALMTGKEWADKARKVVMKIILRKKDRTKMKMMTMVLTVVSWCLFLMHEWYFEM